jgi:hypothetical protein
MRIFGVLAVASMLIACGSTSESDAVAQTNKTGVTATAKSGATGILYQVAGLQRGMPLSAINAKLTKDGYRINNEQKKTSYEDGVKLAIANATGKTYNYSSANGTVYFQEWVKGGEKIVAFYMPAPGDPLLVSASYQASGGMASPADVLSTMTKRYGAPAIVYQRTAQWCAKPTPKGCFNNQELLTVGETTININGPTPDDQQMSRIYEAEARKRGGTPKANF